MMISFDEVVRLYRSSNNPEFDGVGFSSTISFTENIDLVLSLYDNRSALGSFKCIKIDGEDIFNKDDFPSSGREITYTYNVNKGSAETFYPEVTDFVRIKTLKKGEVPKNFYIVNEDYSHSDLSKPPFLIKIESICKLIKNLAKIAHFNDIKSDSNGAFFKLVFILHSESKSSSAVIETKISEYILNITMPDTRIIESLADDNAGSDIHYIEKLNTFRNTLIEYVNSKSSDFITIVSNWEDINNLYINNLASYMSAFSFHKSRKEVSEAEVEYSEKISKVISEISTKALAVPISLIASIAIFESSSYPQAIISFVGIFITSLLTSLLCFSQKKQLERTIHAKETLFIGIEKKLNDDQSEITERLREAKESLSKNEDFCRFILNLTIAISWVPTYIGVFGLLQKFI